MKTRLLEDIDENGSAAPLLERPGGAVRARSLADATAPNPAHAVRKDPGPPGRADTAEPRFAPQPPGFQAGLHVPRADPPTDPQPSPAAGTSPLAADGPDWLAARLQEDATLRDEPEWNSLWKRRLVAWSGAAVLLALGAAAGLWMVQESRVEGALVVVANTSPPVLPATATAGASAAHRPAPAEPAAAAAAAPAPASAAAAAAVSVTPREPEPSREPAAPRHRKVASAQPKLAAPEKQQSSARLRREETLMQCRAHGYDERQCLERSCVMTRFGLACRG